MLHSLNTFSDHDVFFLFFQLFLCLIHRPIYNRLDDDDLWDYKLPSSSSFIINVTDAKFFVESTCEPHRQWMFCIVKIFRQVKEILSERFVYCAL